MESTQQALREAERAAAAPFIDYPATRWWYPPFMAVAFAAMATGTALAIELDRGILGMALVLLALGAVALYMRHYRQRWGTWPRMEAAPREIRGAYRTYFLAVGGALVLSVAAWVTFGWLAGVVTVFLTMLMLFILYERVIYPRAAQRVRERLA